MISWQCDKCSHIEKKSEVCSVYIYAEILPPSFQLKLRPQVHNILLQPALRSMITEQCGHVLVFSITHLDIASSLKPTILSL